MSSGIVDSHQHFWQVGLFDYPWMSPEVEVLYRDYLPPALEPILKQRGIAKTVLVQASNSVAETRWLLELADQFSFIAGVVGWVDLVGNVDEQLAEFVSHPKFRGVRHLVESEPADDWLIQPNVLDGLRALGEHGLTYDLLVHTRHLKYAKTVAEECPQLRLVIDHMAKPPIASGDIGEWAEGIGEVAVYPNVSCKLSGLVTEANRTNWRMEDLKAFVDKALEYFGPKRMMFGSDWPVCLLAANYDRVLETFEILLKGLNDQERSGIFGMNAKEFYRLQE